VRGIELIHLPIVFRNSRSIVSVSVVAGCGTANLLATPTFKGEITDYDISSIAITYQKYFELDLRPRSKSLGFRFHFVVLFRGGSFSYLKS